MLQPLLKCLPLKGRERMMRPFLRSKRETIASVYGYEMKLDLHDYVQRCVYLGCFEREDQSRCTEMIKPGDAVIDIGANCGGYLSLFANLVGEAGLVLGFEPNPRLKGKLEFFQESNSVTQVSLHYRGLSDSPGEIKLYLPPSGNDNEDATMCPVEGWDEVIVPISTLDDELARLSPASPFRLLKIDVEGMEHRVLKGGESCLRAGLVEHLLIEFNSYWLGEQSTSCDKLLDFVLSCGFELLSERPQFDEGGLWNLWFRHLSTDAS